MTPRRVDANQKDIVRDLRKVGVTIAITSGVGKGFPDICCGIQGVTVVGAFNPSRLATVVMREFPGAVVHHGCNLLCEIKSETGKLNEAQQRFHRGWRGQVAVARTVEDALRLAGKG